MNPIAVFYHCKLSGQGIPDEAMAIRILDEQMRALGDSGLSSDASEIHIGLNGTEQDEILLHEIVALNKKVHLWDGNAGEFPTMNLVSEWSRSHPGWNVCYHHMKGVSHNGDLYRNWRRCMQSAVILNWRKCVSDLEAGFDTVGAHWFTHLDQRYWAGNFWWATSDYLSGLPDCSPGSVNGRSYESEVWIGKCRGNPNVMDYSPHQPQHGCRRS